MRSCDPRRMLVCAMVMTCGALATAEVSHPALRPLPTPSDRALASGPTWYVDPSAGDDAADGSVDRPWKTIGFGVAQLKPGDTLCLRGGTYYETLTLHLAGAADAPITLRAYPGELAVLDGGYREFVESPAQAWEPYPHGAPGEYRSVKAYPELGANPQPRRGVFVLGNFGDSMVPLHGYHTVLDLRSDRMFILEDNMTVARGMYCGPGLWYDARVLGNETYGTRRIHVRLAHTDLDYLGADNYRGPTDPRKLPLVIGGPRPVLKLDRATHLRLEDLVLRGSSTCTLEIVGGEGVELDGLTVYAGVSALRLSGTRDLRVRHCAFRGVSAPWSSRYSEKYRGVSTYLLLSAAPESHAVEIAWSEFTDCHDGLFIHNIAALDFHHNLVDNFNDDGIEPGPRNDQRLFRIHHNRIARCLLTFTAHGARAHPDDVPATEGDPVGGLYVYRNVIDLRGPIHTNPPRGPDEPAGFEADGWLCADHGSPIWPVYRFYHNTVVFARPAFRDYYGGGWGGHLFGTQRRVFNNIFVSTDKLPGLNFDPPARADLAADGNLHWSLAEGPAYTGDFFASFRASPVFADSKSRYEPGWAAHDVFSDPRLAALDADWKAPLDPTPRPDSPALDAGVPIHDDWPDPLRQHDRDAPDIGAVPAHSAAWTVGVRGRYTLSGELSAQTRNSGSR